MSVRNRLIASGGVTRYNRAVKASNPPTPRRLTLPRILREPLVFGTLCGLSSAIGYTAANACLRAVADCDPVWVSCVKAFPTVVLFGPFLLVRLLKGLETFPHWQPMQALIVASLVCQLLGNVVFQWSLGVIGMALAVPLTLGAMIVGAAVMGRLILHEPVTITMAVSILILLSAVFVLSLGAGEASERSDEVESQRMTSPNAAMTVSCLPRVKTRYTSCAWPPESLPRVCPA